MAIDASIALTTVSDVELALGLAPGSITGTNLTYLQGLINSISLGAATYLGRPLGYAAGISEQPKGYGWQRIRVQRTPIAVVTTLKIFTDTITLNDDFIIEAQGNTGIIYLKWFAPFTGSRQGRTITQDWLVDTEANDYQQIDILYNGGWWLPNMAGPLPTGAQLLPLDIQFATTLAIVSAYQQRGVDRNVASESLMSHSVTFRRDSGFSNGTPYLPPGWPMDAGGMIARYRRIPQY